MNRVRIPGTSLDVPRLSFGTGSLHLATGNPERLLREALELGFTHFDTSPYYGFGLAERWLGRALAEAGPANSTVATKVGLYPPGGRARTAVEVLARKAAGRVIPSLSRAEVDWSLGRARRSLEGSLKSLRRGHLDLLLLHEPITSLAIVDEFAEWMEELRTHGVVRHWGIAGETNRCLPFLTPPHPIAEVVQTRDSIDRREAHAIVLSGRPLQFTYGYLAAAQSRDGATDPSGVLRGALEMNSTGSVIVSTRSLAHLRRIALGEQAEVR